jgi:hypothetical protein
MYEKWEDQSGRIKKYSHGEWKEFQQKLLDVALAITTLGISANNRAYDEDARKWREFLIAKGYGAERLRSNYGIFQDARKYIEEHPEEYMSYFDPKLYVSRILADSKARKRLEEILPSMSLSREGELYLRLMIALYELNEMIRGTKLEEALQKNR